MARAQTAWVLKNNAEQFLTLRDGKVEWIDDPKDALRLSRRHDAKMIGWFLQTGKPSEHTFG